MEARLEEARAVQVEQTRKQDGMMAELEATWGELSGMESAARELEGAMGRLEISAKRSVEQAESARSALAAELSRQHETMRRERELVVAGLEGMDVICEGLERTVRAGEAESWQVHVCQ